MKNLSNICNVYANMICGGTIDGVSPKNVASIAEKIENTITFVCLDEDNRWIFLTYEQAEYMLDESCESIYPIIELDLVVDMGFGDKE